VIHFPGALFFNPFDTFYYGVLIVFQVVQSFLEGFFPVSQADAQAVAVLFLLSAGVYYLRVIIYISK